MQTMPSMFGPNSHLLDTQRHVLEVTLELIELARGVGCRQGLSLQCGAHRAAGSRRSHLHLRAEAWWSQLARQGGSSRSGLRQPASHPRSPRQTSAAPSRRTSGAAERALLRDRRHATDAPSKTSQHLQTAVDSSRWLQSRATHATAFRIRETAGSPGPSGPVARPFRLPTGHIWRSRRREKAKTVIWVDPALTHGLGRSNDLRPEDGPKTENDHFCHGLLGRSLHRQILRRPTPKPELPRGAVKAAERRMVTPETSRFWDRSGE